MATKVYIAPFVNGPQVAAKTRPSASVGRAGRCFEFLWQAVAGMAPQRLLESSGVLLAIEVVAVATSLGTAGAWLVGVRGDSIAVVLSIDLLLVGALVVGSLIRTALGFGRGSVAVVEPKESRHRAYRVVNQGQPSLARVAGYEASPAMSAGIWQNLELEAVEPATLREGDMFFVQADQTVHADGTVLEGIAMVDESAVTGQSAPVARSAEGESAVMRESRIVAGQILVRVAPRRGHPLDWIHGAPIIDARRPVAVLTRMGDTSRAG